MYTILVVEDDINTNEGICEYLNNTCYKAIAAFDGDEALTLFVQEQVDLVILDIMLPKVSGMAVLTRMKAKKDVPVIMLTAISDEYMQIASFDNLVDDYITKPFSIVLLEKRIASVLRRRERKSYTEVWTNGDVSVDFDAYTATDHNGRIHVTPKEIDLLKLLINNKGIVLTRNQILDVMWDETCYIEDRLVDTYIKNLRKKLRLENIVTIRGVGYKFEVIS